MKIIFRQETLILAHNTTYPAGGVTELPDELARSMIEKGLADPAATPEHAPEPEPEPESDPEHWS